MCTLMMKAGWSLRYSYHGNNTTFCPEETEEFMKQRRRWLLSDFANAAVVAWNLRKFLVRAHLNSKKKQHFLRRLGCQYINHLMFIKMICVATCINYYLVKKKLKFDCFPISL